MRRLSLCMVGCLGGMMAWGGTARGAVYDFSSGAGVQHFAYGISLLLPVPPASSTLPASQVTATSYTALSTSNDTRYTTGRVDGTGNTLAPATRFVFTISEHRSRVTRLDVRWEGAADEDGVQGVWVWNPVTNAYVLVGSQVDVLSPLDATVNGSITLNAANFVDTNNRVIILAAFDSDDVTLFTDYVSLTVTATGCTTSSECDDGIFCNGAEACTGGVCVVGTVVTCNDSNVCTTDSCNEGADRCDNVAINCDNGLYCDGVEICNTVLGCRPGTAINCNDSNLCTTDSCSEATDSCRNLAVNCSDNLYCNGAEFCDPAIGCRPGQPINCNDNDACTADSCNETTDACNNVLRVPPSVPATPNPTDGSIEVPVVRALSWTGSASNATCPRVFDVYLDTVNPPATLAASGLTVLTFTPLALAQATTYYWSVTARDCCTSVPGPVWTFTTVGHPILQAAPASVAFNLPTGQSEPRSVVLSNVGDAPTRWTAVEAVASSVAAVIVEAPVVVDATVVDARLTRKHIEQVSWRAPRHPTTLLVGFRDNVVVNRNIAMAQRDAVHAIRRATKIRSFDSIPVDVVEIENGADIQAVAALYEAMPEVEYVEPNYIYTANAIPNDPSLGLLWGMNNTGQTAGTPDADIDAAEAWDLATGNQSVVVGVIDTGIDYTHPELAANMWTNAAERNGVPGVDDDANGIIDDIYGARWTSGNGLPTNGNPFDDHYHGTHVAGTIGAVGNNGVGVAGVNWSVRMMALKFLNSAGSGTLADAVAAIDYARVKGANLTSNSWGGGGFSQTLKNAIDAAGAAGQLFIAAAGNSALNADFSPMYPAAYVSPTIVSVAATDHLDHLASFSNYGLTSVDLGAPGVNVWSTSPGNTYRTLNGTSMATPHVSGVAALVLSIRPGMAPLDLKALLMSSVDPIPALAGRCVTGGRLNAYRSLLSADPVPWLSMDLASGVLWPGQSVTLVLTGSAVGLNAGSSFLASVRVASGDVSSPLIVPVSLSVRACSLNVDCGDGLACNGVETCNTLGACVPGAAVNCNDGVACTTDACGEPSGTCSRTPNDSLCANGLACDGIETCHATLGCQGGVPVVCNDGVACTVDVCDEFTPACIFIPFDAVCDNARFCDGFEYCDPTLGCQAGTDPCFGLPCDEINQTCGTCATDADCDDFVVCTVDACDVPTGTCTQIPNDTLCSDGLFCNGTEFCDPTFDCQPGGDPCFGLPCHELTDSCGGCLVDSDCDDGIACTVDACDTASNFCTSTPSDARCDNGLFCDGAEVCDAQFDCQPGTPMDCEDGVFCTIDACNEATNACDHSFDHGACQNGIFCDGEEVCDAILDCQVGTPVDCDDAIACTVDSCNEATLVCDHVADNTSCDDGLFCNGAETCSGSGCQAGTNPCSGVACDEATDSCVTTTPDIWMTFATAALIPGVGNIQNEDIVAYDADAGTWRWIFDGSDVGIGSLAIDGMAVLPGGDILLSFSAVGNVPGLIGGPNALSVDGADIVRFTPTALGPVTAGVFSFYFDGSDVGLDTTSENIDAITLAPDGRLVISTTANLSATGVTGLDEDLFIFSATSLGSVTAGTFAMYFDGSDVDLATNAGEDIDAAGIRADGSILLSTVGPFTVTGLTGADEDAFEFAPTQLGATTSGTYRMILDLSALGIDPTENIASLEEVP